MTRALREALGRDRVMAIVRHRDGGDVAASVEGLIAGGIRVLEVTVDTPGSWDIIAEAAARPGVFVGVGTVTSVEEVERVARLGSSFIVSPGLDVVVVHAALDAGLEVFPGVATGTEVLAARRAGCRFFKLFPAGALGTRYLAELRGPFGHEKFVATGGIQIADIERWLAAGAFAVALGSDLVGRVPPRSPVEVAELTERARIALRRAASRAVAER